MANQSLLLSKDFTISGTYLFDISGKPVKQNRLAGMIMDLSKLYSWAVLIVWGQFHIKTWGGGGIDVEVKFSMLEVKIIQYVEGAKIIQNVGMGVRKPVVSHSQWTAEIHSVGGWVGNDSNCEWWGSEIIQSAGSKKLQLCLSHTLNRNALRCNIYQTHEDQTKLHVLQTWDKLVTTPPPGAHDSTGDVIWNSQLLGVIYRHWKFRLKN